MDELHLKIYVERMKREYNGECDLGRPKVAYKESILSVYPFGQTHKKLSDGPGQIAKVMGKMKAIFFADS